MKKYIFILTIFLLGSIESSPAQEILSTDFIVVNTATTVDPKLLNIGADYRCVFEYGGHFKGVPEAIAQRFRYQVPNEKLNIGPYAFSNGWMKVYLVRTKDFRVPRYRHFAPNSDFVYVEGRIDGSKDGEEEISEFSRLDLLLAEQNSSRTIDLCKKLYAKYTIKQLKQIEDRLANRPECTLPNGSKR